MSTGTSWEPVTRGPHESTQMFGRRRRQQIKNQYEMGVTIPMLAALHGVSVDYVADAVGVQTDRYEWTPTEDILRGPFPTYEEAVAEAPLIVDQPYRMTTDQAIERACQFYRWHMAGMTFREIGEKHGITRERVRKVLTKFGFPVVYEPSWRSGQPKPLPPVVDEVTGKVFRRRKA